MKALMVLALVATPAHARSWRTLADELTYGTWLHYEVSELHEVEGPDQRFDDLVLAGFRLHGFVGKHGVGWHVGLDASAGSTIHRAGFAYDVAFLPIGVAFKWGDTQMIGLGTGVGAMGAVGTLDDAATFPIEAFAELAVGSRIRILARGRASYVAGAGGRARGSPTLGFADELDATLGIRIGHSFHEWGFPSGDGYFAGVGYRELLGSKFVGLVVGYSVDLASPRHGGDREVVE
jgi:hypothetical protein